MKKAILDCLPPDFPWADRITYLPVTDSTNLQLKALAQKGAPHGTVLLAGYQTQGRGRMGRSFLSPQGQGVYMSLLLRPQCSARELMHLTCAVGVGLCDGLQRLTGLRPGLKWINDLVWDRRKLGGILTELGLVPGTDRVDWAVVGIGINCSGDLSAELGNMTVNLSEMAERPISPASAAAAVIQSLYGLSTQLLQAREGLMAQYRRDCITLGQAVRISGEEAHRIGTAVQVLSDGSLVIRYEDESEKTVSSGEVSVRGLYGYV